MKPTKHSDINFLLEKLLAGIKSALGDKLVGLYLTGSLVWGEFNKGVSDIDLVAALSSDINDSEFNALEKMHQDFAKEHSEWDDRIDVSYMSVNDLLSIKSLNGKLIKISSGEPLNRKESNKERIVLWYLTREKSIILFGPDPKTVIEPISREEFIDAVRIHATSWLEYVKETKNSRPSQAYAILTMCRAIYVITNDEQVSKTKAAIWTAKKFPEWAPLIHNALNWRAELKNKEIDDQVTYPQAVEFVDFIRDQIVQ